MTGDAAQVRAHYGREPLVQRLRRALDAAGLGSTHVDPERLAPLDHFHTGGRAATEALLSLLDLGPGLRVLDVGAGLAGPARLIAARHGCRVTCVDLTPEYCEAARWLNALTDLDGLVDVVCGDALGLPFRAGSFDLVWTQNVAMNIPDRGRLYGDLRRVVRPGGRLAMQEVTAGRSSEPLRYPVPWAERASLSTLVEEKELRKLLRAAGWEAQSWEDISAWALTLPPPSADPVLGLHVYVPDAQLKQRNSRRNLAEGRTGLVRAVLRAL